MSLSAKIFFAVFSVIGMAVTLRVALRMAVGLLHQTSGNSAKMFTVICAECSVKGRQNCDGCSPSVYLKGEAK